MPPTFSSKSPGSTGFSVPHFDFDEQVLAVGAAVHAQAVTDFLFS
jgi:hypothetical protein